MIINFNFIINSFLLGVGLAMDTFSLSIVNTLTEPKMTRIKMSLVCGVYAFFQFLMPMIGWICVHTILDYFKSFEKFIPWIALILLLYIGIKMLIEGFSSKKDDNSEQVEKKTLTFGILILQGIATSIDALSVGFTIAEYYLSVALVCAIIIAFTTFIVSFSGLLIGKKVGTKLNNRASILGGIILIGIGLEIFIRNL